MAKKDFLENIDEITEGADMTASKKKVAKKTTGKPEMKIKTISLPVGWDKKIKEFTGSPSTAYIANAIKEQMLKDGIL